MGLGTSPRARENQPVRARICLQQGTSPRARGKLPGQLEEVTEKRNIPACAGKTPCRRHGWRSRREHPRVRGENSSLGKPAHNLKGTSPRARGKQCNTLTNAPNSRNIPACAGKTGCEQQAGRVQGEHPRVRGENIAPPGEGRLQGGTSPRARGKLADRA